MSQQTLESNAATAVFEADLKWVADTLKTGCLILAVLDPKEHLPKSAKGFKPLRGVMLTKSATKIFNEALGETIFVEDRLEITIRTENLAADLAAEKGIKGNPYLIGTAVKVTIPMPTTTHASKAEIKQNL